MCEQRCARKQLICRLWTTNSVMPIDAKKPRTAGLFFHDQSRSTDFRHVRGLGSFLSLYNFEFDLVPFGERFES